MPVPPGTTLLVGPTIPAGESLSNALDVSSGLIFRILMPDAWSSEASISFQLSIDGGKFYNVFDEYGKEIIVPCIPTSVLPFRQYAMHMGALKIRSGSLTAPIVQEATRIFGIVLDTRATV